jgi:hypothetical protein
MDGAEMQTKILANVSQDHEYGWNGSKCWMWIGARSSNGYGTLTHGGRRMLAHRLAFDAFTPYPRRHCVCHRCDRV